MKRKHGQNSGQVPTDVGEWTQRMQSSTERFCLKKTKNYILVYTYTYIEVSSKIKHHRSFRGTGIKKKSESLAISVFH